MAAFKLTYFPFYGRAEAIRMLFVHAKADWIDEIIPVPEFAARKAAGDSPMVRFQYSLTRAEY